MDTRPAPRGPELITSKGILLAILWRLVTTFDTLECLHPERIAEAEEAWARTEAWLKSLGATIVIKDQASVKASGALELHSCVPGQSLGVDVWQRLFACIIKECWKVFQISASFPILGQKTKEVALDSLQFFGRPKLALDAVGGQSAVRLVEALAEVRV
eukprot:1162029-Pelagomonas_calceolata.AAC.9